MNDEKIRWQIKVKAPGAKWSTRPGTFETKTRADEVARDIRLYSGIKAKVQRYVKKA